MNIKQFTNNLKQAVLNTIYVFDELKYIFYNIFEAIIIILMFISAMIVSAVASILIVSLLYELIKYIIK